MCCFSAKHAALRSKRKDWLAQNRGFEQRSGETKDYKIGMCCFSAKHAALGSKSKDWLAPNQNNVSEWSDMSTRGLLFQWASTITIQISVLKHSGPHHIAGKLLILCWTTITHSMSKNNKNPTKLVDTKWNSSSSHWKLTCSCHDIAGKLLTVYPHIILNGLYF